MTISTKEPPVTGKVSSKGEVPNKQVNNPIERDYHGRYLPGTSGNTNGRPPAGATIVDQFRDNPKCISVLEKIFKVASTLGDEDQHKDALQAAKLVAERLVPVLKSSDLKLNTDDDQGFVFMPTQESPEKE
tara:strand:- start:1569 stop:1961 length:393 start_codon:yes stop_codon:yes gene_type:complete